MLAQLYRNMIGEGICNWFYIGQILFDFIIFIKDYALPTNFESYQVRILEKIPKGNGPLDFWCIALVDIHIHDCILLNGNRQVSKVQRFLAL